MAFISKFTGPEIDRRLAQGTYDDAVAAGFTGTKEQFDAWIAAYTPAEMEKLNNKQDKEDPMLETENKTVVGAINLLNSEKQDKEDERLATESKIVVDAINELNTRTTDLYYDKQDKEDSSLATEQKTIVGAINELKLGLQNWDSQKQDKVDDGFATNDKSVVGAVNEIHNELDTCVADYNEHIDEYEVFKANTENTLNSHSTQIGQLTQEKQDKTDLNLSTKSKTVVDAINENHAAITAEVARSVAEDARLDETKVSYTDISDDTNPDRKTIMLKNHDSLSGYGTDGTTAYNLAMVSKWDKADFGASGIPINLNGSEDHPTYNDSEKLAFVSELTGESSKLAEDIKTLNETVATINQNLEDSVSTLDKNMVDGFNTINDSINNEIRPAIKKNAKDIGVVNNTLTTKINETEETLQADINYLKPRVSTLESLQIVKVDSDNEVYAASYELQDATGKVYGQRINIATDKFIKSVTYDNQTLTIVFVLEDGSEYSQNIDVSELMNVYTAGGGITISDTGVVSISDDTLQMIQYADSEVRRLETAKIPYAYDEKTQSNINVILPEGGSYLGNYGDENATIAKAAVYDGVKQLELGSSKVHTNINTDSDVTIETSTGKKTIATTDELVNIVNIPIRSLQDKVYTQEEIFDWFGVTSVPELKQKITRGSQMYLRYGISLSGNPMYYKMPIEYTAFESANQIKLVLVGLNTRDDVTSKYEIIINLDGTIIEGNSNVKLTLLSLEPDLSQYALKSELPDVSDFVTKEEVPNIFETNGLTELKTGESSSNIEAALGIDFASLIEIIRKNKAVIVDRNSAGDYKACIHATGNISSGNGAANLMFFIGTTPTIYQVQYVSGTFALAVTEYEFADKDEIPDVSNLATKSEVNAKQDTLVSGTNIKTLNGESLLGEGNIQLDEGPTNYETLTNKPSINSVELSGNLSFEDLGLDINPTWEQIQNKPTFANVATSGDYNDLTDTPDLTIYQPITDNSLATNAKMIPAAINEIKESVDSISDPYEINLTNLLSAEDSESISTAIGGIDNLNATVQDNRIIVGTISNGNVSVSIRILGNVTTLYYLLDSVVGLTLNEVKITNTSGTLSKNVTTHSVLTENMVINSLTSDETTLPLSAAQGKVLNDSKQAKEDDTLDTTSKAVVGAINELKSSVDSKATPQNITDAVNALDVETVDTVSGEVIKSVGQVDGKVVVEKKALTSEDIPELSQSKIQNLVESLGAKQNSTVESLPTTAKTVEGAVAELKTSIDSHAQNTSNPHNVTKSQVGLGNVDNTSDVNKPVSTATQEALNLKQNATVESLPTTSKTIEGAIAELKTAVDSKASSAAVNAKQNATDQSLQTTDKTIVGAINEILPKATGVGKVDPNSDGTGEIFNSYEGADVNVASGPYSHAEGNYTKAIGSRSHAEGSLTTARGVNSHAEGSYTTATGVNSHAEGSSTTARGSCSHAEGSSNTASGDYSHAEGFITQAFSSSEHAEGSYNKSYDSEDASVRVIHSVGIGSAESDRKNAHEIKINGDHYVFGVGGYDGTNPDTAQSLQTVLSNLGPNIIEVPELSADYNIPANATNREFLYIIEVGATLHNVTGDSAIKWAGGVAPQTSANSTMVVSIVKNLATWNVFIALW